MTEPKIEQVDQIRSWLAGDLYPEHETFSMGRGFAQAVIAEVERLALLVDVLSHELREVLEDAATALDVPINADYGAKPNGVLRLDVTEAIRADTP